VAPPPQQQPVLAPAMGAGAASSTDGASEVAAGDTYVDFEGEHVTIGKLGVPEAVVEMDPEEARLQKAKDEQDHEVMVESISLSRSESTD